MSMKLKRIFCLALALLCLCACGKTEGDGKAPSGSGSAGTGGAGTEPAELSGGAGGGETVTALASVLTELPEGMAYASAQCRVGDTVWLGGMGGDGAVMGSVPLGGGAAGAPPAMPEGCEYIYAMCPLGENFAVLAGSFLEYYVDAGGQYVDVEAPDGRLELLVCDGTQFVSRVELAERYGQEESHFSGFTAMLELDGSFYALSSPMIVKLAPDGTELVRFDGVEGSEALASMCVFDGEIIAASFDWSTFSSKIYRLDAGTLALLGEAELPETDVSALGTAGGALIADNGEGVYALDGEMQPGEELFSWPELFVSGGVDAIEEIEDGYLFYTRGQEQLRCARWREGPARTTVVLAADSSYGGAQTLANEFNLSQSEYFIKVNVYEAYEEGDMTRLQTEIGAGNWPDLFAFSSADTLADIKSEAALVNLYELMEADPGLSRDDFVAPLLSVMEERGALYWLPYKFDVVTMIAPASLLGHSGVSVEEVTTVARENNIVPIQQWITRESMLSWCGMAAVQQYVDWDAGTCSFDSEGFVHLLELCGGLFAGEDVNNGEQYTGPDNPSLLTRYFLMSPHGVAALRESLGDYCFAGFPETMGNGSVFEPLLRFAVTSGAREKDGAWEFIKFASGERGQNARAVSGLTANAAMLEAELSSLLRDGWTDSQGNRHDFTEADAEKFRELIEGAELVMGSYPTLQKIISDCAGGYFAGDKTAEQTAKDIQARAAIYVAERG